MSKGGGGGDSGAGCIIFLVIIGFILMVIAALVTAYLSVLFGKLFNYVIRIIFGWSLSIWDNKEYVAFCTIMVLFIIPIVFWLALVLIGLQIRDPVALFLVVGYSTLGLIGYYSGHFGMPPERFDFLFSWLQAPGVLKIHEQEDIWRNSLRTKGLIFWHWTIARRAVAIDDWFQNTIGNLAGSLSG